MITFSGRKTCNQQWHASTDLKRDAASRNKQVKDSQVVKKSVRKSRKRKRHNSETEDSTGAMVNDENAPPPAENIPPRRLAENVRSESEDSTDNMVNDENAPPPPLVVFVPRRSRRRKSGELSSVLEEVAETLVSVRKSCPVREMADL
jgi:hypothetical protein